MHRTLSILILSIFLISLTSRADILPFDQAASGSITPSIVKHHSFQSAPNILELQKINVEPPLKLKKKRLKRLLMLRLRVLLEQPVLLRLLKRPVKEHRKLPQKLRKRNKNKCYLCPRLKLVFGYWCWFLFRIILPVLKFLKSLTARLTRLI